MGENQMKFDEMSKGRHAPSKQYFFGSQDGIIGASMQCRNPELSPAENVINTLLDVFFFEITPRTNGREVSGAQVAKTVQFLGNPHFHLTCEGLKRTGEEEPISTVKLFVVSAGIGRLHGRSGARGIQQRALSFAPPGFFSSSMSGTGQHVVVRYFNTDAHMSAEELAARAEEWRHHLKGRFTTQPVVLPHDMFESVHAAACWALEQVRPFAAPDFTLVLARSSKLGFVRDAIKAENACENAKELYRGLASFAVKYTPLIVSEQEIQRLLVAHQFTTLSEAGSVAQEVVFKRLDDAREEYKRQQSAEEARAATLGAARLAEWRREEIAARRAEERRLEGVERARLQALQDFHSEFRECAVCESAQSMLASLESGSGIPAALRQHGELVVNQILNPLRQHLLDLRGDALDRQGDPAVQRLAHLVFSPLTIAVIARAFGIDTARCLKVPPPSDRVAPESNVRELSELYGASPAVRGMIRTMLAQADGIIVLAALALPPLEVARYARERNWRASGSEHGQSEARAALAAKLTRVIEDKITVRLARESMPALDPSPEKKKSQVEIPEWIEEVVNLEEFAYGLEEGQLVIASREAPALAICIPAKGFSSKEVFQKEYKQKLNGLLSEVEVEKRIDALESSCGFTVSRERDDKGRHVTLRHAEYELAVTLEGLPGRWHAPLTALEQQFNQCETSWALLLERAERAGFRVDRGSRWTKISHPTLGEHWIAEGAFTPVRQLPRVTVLVDDAERRREAELQDTVRKERRAARIERVLREEVLPVVGDHIVVPDANVFMALSAPRSGGGTWLDLLTATAELKHIRMMVPAIVADFELTGRVIPFDAREQSGTMPSMLSWTSSAVHTCRQFFDGATRLRIERRSDGTFGVGEASLGSNRNVCIVESPGDEEFYERVSALETESCGNVRLFHELVRSELYHGNEGDAAITRFLLSCPFLNHVTVITSDLKYLRGDMPKTTGCGAPVSGCSVGSYVAAECENRGDVLGELLSSPEPIHFHTIADDIVKNTEQSPYGPRYLFPFSARGTSVVSGIVAREIREALKDR
jgi:hypothetical protein